MIKYIEAPDIHAHKNWLDITLECLDKIGETAIKEKVDFITFPGDLHDSRFYVGDGSGYNTFRKKIKELLQICPIAAVEGTESHDGAGSYGPLEDLGLVLLRPGKVYGLLDKKIGIVEGVYYNLDCVLFGIPEINKSTINSKLGHSAEAGNAEAVNLLSQYIQEFIGPMRLKYKDIPAIGLLHGAVSDTKKEHSTDIVIKASDIVIDTDILRLANLDRWSLGHFHCPWESENICAGYAGYPGIDSNPWGKRDFIPGMNLIEITAESSPRVHDIIRIPYGTPGRIKIYEPQSVYLPDFAYWLETEDPDAVLPEGLHPWSRITYKENVIETRRVTKDEAEKAHSLWDLFKLIDPDVQPHLKDKVDSIPVKDKFAGFKLDARLTHVAVWGSSLFGKKRFEWDLTQLADGLNQLIGPNGNGDGKSSGLGVCSFYPVVIGKDPKSGRKSAIKDFFSLPDSGIEKYGIVNGHEHHHLITIKGAHTQNPKTECYLYIDGVSQLEKATFDTMFKKCEELYGSYEDYIITTFYEQPQQSKDQRSGLMTIGATEARNLVQNIAGIDHEADKRFALDKVKEFDNRIQQLNADINALTEYSEDPETIKKSITEKGTEIAHKIIGVNNLKAKGFKLKSEVEALQEKKTENEKLKEQKKNKEDQIQKLMESVSNSVTKITSLKNAVGSLGLNQDSLKEDDENKKLHDARNKLELEYSKKLGEYNQAISTYNNDVNAQEKIRDFQQGRITESEIVKQSNNTEIALISKPCPACGYIDPEIIQKVDVINTQIGILDDQIAEAFSIIEKLIPVKKTELTKPPELPESDIPKLFSETDRKSIQDSIDEGLKAESVIKELQISITKDNNSIAEYEKDLIEIIIDNEIDDLFTTTEAALTAKRKEYTESVSAYSTLEAEKKALNDNLEKAEKSAADLITKQDTLKIEEVEKIDWVYIAKMLNPDKIPGLELEIILDTIDTEATRNIEPFLEGRYSYHTETQKQSNKALVDKFDVLIHDAETGESFSMFYTNPGNKAFYSDCYIKALIRKRNERQMRSYSPIIYDEADGPVNPIRVKAYYDIQQAYFKNEKVIFVSQKSISSSYAQKEFNIEELKS